MKEIINKFLLERHKFIFEIHLKQPRFTFNACGPVTKNEERVQKLKKKKKRYKIYLQKCTRLKLVINMMWLIEILKI